MHPKIFAIVHLTDNQTNQIWGQSNDRPVCGYFSTQRWQPGQVVPDQHLINIDPNTPPGTYAITVGLYDPNTGARVPLLDKSNEAVANFVNLTTIPVQQKP